MELSLAGTSICIDNHVFSLHPGANVFLLRGNWTGSLQRSISNEAQAQAKTTLQTELER